MTVALFSSPSACWCRCLCTISCCRSTCGDMETCLSLAILPAAGDGNETCIPAARAAKTAFQMKSLYDTNIVLSLQVFNLPASYAVQCWTPACAFAQALHHRRFFSTGNHGIQLYVYSCIHRPRRHSTFGRPLREAHADTIRILVVNTSTSNTCLDHVYTYVFTVLLAKRK
jgi:hypothetical protein